MTNSRQDLERLLLENLKREGLKSLNFFTEQILGFKNKDFHAEWYGFVENHQVIILAPRSHAKTTCLSINYPLWLIAGNPNVRIILASNTITQAQSFLRELTSHLEADKMFRAVFGTLKPEIPVRWTDTEIIVLRDKLVKDATVSCVGTGGTVLTKRADVIICDDILDSENTATLEQRKKVKDWFFRTLLPCLEPEGKLIVVGTRWNTQDLYGELLKDESFNVRKTYKAIKDDGTALWEERWSLEKLMEKKRSAGSLIFNQQYQNEAIDDESALFKQSWLKMDKNDIDISKLDIYGALDPAISQKQSADYSAFTTVGVDKSGKIYVLDVARGHWTVAELIQTIFNKYAFFKHKRIGVETVAFQQVIKSELDRISQEKRIYLPTAELKPDKDKYRRASALTPFFENGVIFLKENQVELIDELLQFPTGRHDDCVDALAYAVQMVKEVPPEPRITWLNVDRDEEPPQSSLIEKIKASGNHYKLGHSRR
jgi:predicted phage terminase large subunit-like protein